MRKVMKPIFEVFYRRLGWVHIGTIRLASGDIAHFSRKEGSSAIKISLGRDFGIFDKISFADTHLGIAFFSDSTTWLQLVSYEATGSGLLPRGITFDEFHRRFVFLDDGEVFSIPSGDIAEINRVLPLPCIRVP